VSASLTGLSPNTTYHFRISAKNAGASSKGTDAEFKTLEEVVIVPPEDPLAEIHQLLQEVGSAQIPRGIRHKLSRLLSDAGQSLEEVSGYGQLPPAPKLTRGRLPATVDVLSAKARKADRDECTHQRACRDLERFIHVIARDQSMPTPEIPADLASKWSRAARSIETSLGRTRDDESGGDSSDGRGD
jgi:hypothetical protein